MLLRGSVIGIAGAYRTIENIMYKSEPSLMFVSKNTGKERQIFQSIRPGIEAKMKDYTVAEKAGMMALQTLVGFSRYKEDFKYSNDYEIGENGEKIYNDKISTVTHGVNIKTLQALEKLGYIKIDSIDEKCKQSFIGKLTGKEPEEKETFLIVEKLGFRNYGDLRKIAEAGVKNVKATITRNNEEKEEAQKTLSSMKKKFSKVNFRLTDKTIDFEELCLKSANPNELSKEERVALKRLSIIFDPNAGILSTQNIDIAKDRYGRDIIKYDSKEPFSKKVQWQQVINKIDNRNIREEYKVEQKDLINTKQVQENTIQNEIGSEER